jgi:hypothetical protein
MRIACLCSNFFLNFLQRKFVAQPKNSQSILSLIINCLSNGEELTIIVIITNDDDDYVAK